MEEVLYLEDVASVLKEVALSENKFINKEFQVITGNQSIIEALSSFE